MQAGSEPESGIPTRLDPEVQAAPQARCPQQDAGPGSGLHWWVEVLVVLGFYVVYATIRNLFGSESVPALSLIHI